MDIWMIFLAAYVSIGCCRFGYLCEVGRVEGDFYEFVLHGVLWPLDLACWIEEKVRSR